MILLARIKMALIYWRTKEEPADTPCMRRPWRRQDPSDLQDWRRPGQTNWADQSGLKVTRVGQINRQCPLLLTECFFVNFLVENL